MNRVNKCGKKDSNPVLRANVFSKWSFWWLKNLFKKGNRQPLTEEDLFEAIPKLDSERITNKFIQLWKDESKHKNPSLIRMFIKVYGFKFLSLASIFAFVESTARISQPLCLGYLVSYFTQKDNKEGVISNSDAYLFALGIVLCSIIPVLTFHPFIFYVFTLGTKIRLACSGLIYRKILRLSKSSSSDGLSARAINILSNDLGKFDVALVFIHDLWKGPVEAIVFGYLMYLEIGISAVIGVAFLLSFIPLQAYGAKKAAQYRLRTAKRTDLRVKLMNEIIQGIQLIKMYAWEKSFANVIAKVRQKEINVIRGSMRIYASLATTSMISKLSIFLSLISYIYFGNAITARKVFIVSSIFNTLNESMVHFWPLAITFCAEAYISAKRVKDFLLEDEGRVLSAKQNEINHNYHNLKAKLNGNENAKNNFEIERIVEISMESNDSIEKISSKNGIILKKATAFWNDNSDVSFANKSIALKDIDLEMNECSLTAIVGPVGAGKSTLLSLILGEVQLDSGQMLVNGCLSYACQEPWLFEGSIRDNIIFVEEFDERRYNKIIRICALKTDLEQLPQGDLTIVGERGISLSGGQKARVNLARAIYKKADIYLLDDPLSAVDAHVGKHIFDYCIKNFLADKICILVTHQLQYLQDVEKLVLINFGQIEAQGSFKSLQSLNKFNFLVETHDESGDDRKSSKSSLSESDIDEIIQKSDLSYDQDEDRKEFQTIGTVKFSVYKSYFESLGNWFWFVCIIFVFIICRILLSGVEYFLSRWVNWEESITKTVPQNSSASTVNEISSERTDLIVIYSTLLGCSLLLYFVRTFGFFNMCLKISLHLHDKLFNGVIRASMYFFNTNPSGRILNRFSKDISSIDSALPQSMLDCFSFFTDISAIFIVVCIANYWLLIPGFLMVSVIIILKNFYMKTSRSVKRIDSITRSPIYSHTNQTFQGLTTIRAFKAEKEIETVFHECQNANTSAWYIYLATSRAFALWLDVFCVMYVAAVTFSFLLMEDQFSSGDVGLAIMQCIAIVGSCQWGLRQTAELENQMTSVERVLEYVNLPSEAALVSSAENKPPTEWPMEGKLKFTKLFLKYSENGEKILKDINFEIAPKEKIGIVGRTGAGKSSIIQSIFRLACNEGSIEIDNVNIEKLGLHDLRSKISIIPQDPVLFSGTLRYNLDPFETLSDSKLWEALNEVELKNHVSSLTGGLNCKVSDGGSNFSLGQRQLVCLARAILRDNKILILDEATANVDPETDQLIQKTIRSKFADCTVLTIAHRLHTVMDSDRVLVMDSGEAVEIGHPYELLSDMTGFLRKLVNQTGTQTSMILMQTAKNNYNLKRSN